MRILKLLMVSAGGGVLLGAGLRLGERSRGKGGDFYIGSDKRIELFLTRLEALERKVDSLQAERDVLAGSVSDDLPLQAWDSENRDLEAEINAQIAAMEERLRRELGRHHENGLGSVSEGLEERIERRMKPLEEEISTQRASVEELREYSLRTERSLQKLLEGVDRLVAAQATRVGDSHNS